MPALERIQQEIDAITQEQLDMAAASLREAQEGEEVIGCVDDQPYIHRVWALAQDYDQRSALAAFAVRFGKTKDKKQSTREIQGLEMIESFVRDLAWLEIRQHLPHSLDYDVLGLRTGYVVVASRARAQHLENTLAAFREAVQKVFGVPPKDDEEEEKIQ